MALIDVIGRGAVLPRHRHDAPYAAVVLEGGYEEAGDGGRFRVRAGDVLIHGAFSAHLDRADRKAFELVDEIGSGVERYEARIRREVERAVSRELDRIGIAL